MKYFSASTCVLLIFVSVTFFGCKRQEKQVEVKAPKGGVELGGTLKVPINQFPESLSPTSLGTRAASAIGLHIYDGLLRLDPKTGEIIPGIAASWSEEQGGQAYIFNLRKGVKFHESDFFGNRSREVTANDVAYSFNQLAHTSSDELFQATLSKSVLGADAFRNGETEFFKGVEVVDDYTLKIVLTKPDPSFLYVLAHPALAVGPMNYLQGENGQYIGTGPFVYASSSPNILLTKNYDYYLEDAFGNHYPYLDSLVFVEANQNTDKLLAFFDGRIDLISNLELDPVRDILEQHVTEFSGKLPKYVMKRETENASYETYTIYKAGVKDLGSGFMGYIDYSRTQIEQ